MKYVTSRKGPGWKNSSLSLAPTITDTSISFVDSGFIDVFDSTQAVVEVDFLVDCVDLGDTTRVQFRFDSTGAPNANRYFRGSTDYWPGFDDGDIVAGEPWPDMGPVGILCPGTHTVEIGDEFKVHALYNSSYSALGGVKTAWRWSSNLRFLGIDTVGTYLQGKDLTVTTFSNDSLYVHTSDSVASEGPDTLFYLVFADSAGSDNVTDTVVNMWDSVFSGCSFLLKGNTSPNPHFVYVPQYTATIDIVDRSLDTGSTAAITVRLLNNFTVDMIRTHQDTVAAFHVDTAWTKITWAGYHEPIPFR